MKTTLLLGTLCLGAGGALAQGATAPAKPAPAPPVATNAAPKPATNNPNVVVLRSETKFWSDAALNKPVSLTLKDADARAAVAALANVSQLPMNVIVPPPPAVVTPPVPAANGARPTAAPTPVQPARVSLEIKSQPVRDVMQTLANSFHLTWRKDGATYVLKDMNFVDTLRAEPAGTSGARQPTYNSGYNNRNNGRYDRRGGREVAPGIYRQRRSR